MIAIQVIDALLALFAVADRFGINLATVQKAFADAKAEGRDVRATEVRAMAAQATQSGKDLQKIIDGMGA
jgi:type II secretory pathway component PulM